jgi:hypothetical protein
MHDDIAVRKHTLQGLFDRIGCRVPLSNSSRRRDADDDVGERSST